LSADVEISKPRRFRLTCRRAGCLVLCIPVVVVGFFALFISLISPPATAPAAPQPFPADFEKGITLESWWKGEFSSANSDQTLATIVQPSGANWVAVIVKCYQATKESTDISCNSNPVSPTDDDLRHVIQQAHSLGLKVLLKPHVDFSNLANSSDGRFNINFGNDEAAWTAWFASYTTLITHYAALAQALGVEAFTVGTELEGTVGRADQWREVIRQIRAVYSGQLTYAALTYFEPLQVTWWDALDMIGVDAYFTVTLNNNATLAQMKLGWTPTVAYLGWLSTRWNKPIILTEAGYMSVDGTNVLPGDWSNPGHLDDEEQADAYEALFEAFEGHDWWRGVFWWSLSTDPNQGGANDRGYSFHDKPAEDVLRRYFGG